MAADLVTIATTAVLTQFLTPAAKSLGEVALERVKHIGSKAVGYLTAVGREAQPVEEKLLYPLLQAASLESDPSLADLWAALLANAADPAQKAPVQPSFADVLRQLMPTDAVILAHIYKRARVDEQAILQYELGRIVTQRMPTELNMTDKQFALGVDTLLRLRLCAPPTPRPEKGGSIGGIAAATLQVCPTVFGVAFLAAVTPPTA
jgi:hypothetical protein